MNYSRRDILVGFVIVIVIVLGVLLFKKLKTPKVLPTPIPQEISFKNDLEDSFNFYIPDNVKTVELKDISGGNGRGIATSTDILADIQDPASSYFYQAWLEDNGKFVSLGKLRTAKGGWLLEYDGSKYPEYKKLVVSLEKVFDNLLEKRILEGSF